MLLFLFYTDLSVLWPCPHTDLTVLWQAVHGPVGPVVLYSPSGWS